MKRMAIVIRDDAYDRLYTPLTFAYLAAKKGIEVNILFVLWAVRVLTEQGAKAVKMDRQHATEEEWFKDRVRRDGDPLEIHDFIKLVKRTGNVRLYGCQLAAATFDVTQSQLIPEADGIVDALWFLEEKAIKADHCQYF
jgi:peroxiredoxin family protein